MNASCQICQSQNYCNIFKKYTQHTDIPLVANGEIWNAEDAQRCQSQSECTNLMIGRGALAMPNLAMSIKEGVAPMPWSELAALLIQYSGYEIFGDKGKYYPNRIKQWCGYLKRQYPEAEVLFNDIRRLTKSQDIVDVLARQADI